MKVTIEIECNNAAFDGNLYSELARILEGITDRLTEGEIQLELRPMIYLKDLNGNTVGMLKVTNDD